MKHSTTVVAEPVKGRPEGEEQPQPFLRLSMATIASGIGALDQLERAEAWSIGAAAWERSLRQPDPKNAIPVEVAAYLTAMIIGRCIIQGTDPVLIGELLAFVRIRAVQIIHEIEAQPQGEVGHA
jgi:hypothetical protein